MSDPIGINQTVELLKQGLIGAALFGIVSLLFFFGVWFLYNLFHEVDDVAEVMMEPKEKPEDDGTPWYREPLTEEEIERRSDLLKEKLDKHDMI